MAQKGNDVITSFSGSINTTTAVVAAPASDKRHVIRALHFTTTQAGAVVFQDGSGGSTVLAVYGAANTPVTVPADVFGIAGVRLTKGNALHAVLTSATLHAVIRTSLED